MKNICFLVLMIFITTSTGAQSTSNRTTLGRKYAETELKATLKGNGHNVIDNKTLILKDSTTAIKVAEPILFSIYGEDNITKQRPYETFLIDNYWVISGTLPKEMHGGTFIIIIDAHNAKVIRITHGK